MKLAVRGHGNYHQNSKNSGERIPEDLSVVGYDNIAISASTIRD